MMMLPTYSGAFKRKAIPEVQRRILFASLISLVVALICTTYAAVSKDSEITKLVSRVRQLSTHAEILESENAFLKARGEHKERAFEELKNLFEHSELELLELRNIVSSRNAAIDLPLLSTLGFDSDMIHPREGGRGLTRELEKRLEVCDLQKTLLTGCEQRVASMEAKHQEHEREWQELMERWRNFGLQTHKETIRLKAEVRLLELNMTETAKKKVEKQAAVLQDMEADEYDPFRMPPLEPGL